jgi:hypothetical protein
MHPLQKNSAKALQMLDTVPVSYIILESMLMEQNFNQQFLRLVRDAPGQWQLVRLEGDVAIYKRLGG